MVILLLILAVSAAPCTLNELHDAMKVVNMFSYYAEECVKNHATESYSSCSLSCDYAEETFQQLTKCELRNGTGILNHQMDILKPYCEECRALKDIEVANDEIPIPVSEAALPAVEYISLLSVLFSMLH